MSLTPKYTLLPPIPTNKSLSFENRFYMREPEVANALQKRGLPSELITNVLNFDDQKYRRDNYVEGRGNTSDVDRTPGDFGMRFSKPSNSDNIKEYNDLPILDQRIYRQLSLYYNVHKNIMATIEPIKLSNYLFSDYVNYYNNHKTDMPLLIHPNLIRKMFPEPTIHRAETPLKKSIITLPPIKTKKSIGGKKRKTRKHRGRRVSRV